MNVALLSNYKTRNLGNLALTRSVQRLLADAYGPEHLLALHRLPHPIAELATRGELGDWAPGLEAQLGPFAALSPPAPESFGERSPGLAGTTTEEAPSGGRALATRLAHTGVGLRVRARLDREQGRTHIGALLAAEDVVWNAGGELNSYATPTSRLLDAAVALDQGRRTYLVNFSLETTPESLAFLQRSAFRLHGVIGRDERTVAAMVDLGVASDRALLAPDAVFLVGSPMLPELPLPPLRPRREAIGIVLHGVAPIDAVRWAEVVTDARRAGQQVEILSSHRSVDGAVIAQLVDAVGPDQIDVRPEFTDIGAYLAHLSSLQAVVTARFHTAVLGLLAGTTVVGVDTYGAKVAGGLRAAGFAGAVAEGVDWPEQASAIVAEGRTTDRDTIDGVRERVHATWSRFFGSPPD